nr:MAG TPA: hypothetical protein [Caudoviricetes sp.]
MSLIQLYHVNGEYGEYDTFMDWFTKNSLECCADLTILPAVDNRILGELSQCLCVCTYNYKKNTMLWR